MIREGPFHSPKGGNDGGGVKLWTGHKTIPLNQRDFVSEKQKPLYLDVASVAWAKKWAKKR